jgi:hypothetical protein
MLRAGRMSGNGKGRSRWERGRLPNPKEQTCSMSDVARLKPIRPGP